MQTRPRVEQELRSLVEHMRSFPGFSWVKGNNKITEQSSKGKGKLHKSTDKISQQPENWENGNGSDLVQAFAMQWWVESDFTAPNPPLPLHYLIFSCFCRSLFVFLSFVCVAMA